jgi:formimidoylglutamate deiminase
MNNHFDPTPSEASVFASDALLPDGWSKNVLLSWDASGRLTRIQPDTTAPAGVAVLVGPVLPGMPNLHSHAFQRAFAGLTEQRADARDSFWSWRRLMYRFAARLGPQQLEAIATWLYVEMLEAGYTSVCEFQYLHHQPDGSPYADDATLSLTLLHAAQVAGIGITLLPVLYQASGFGALPPRDEQRRFIRSVPSMIKLLESVKSHCDRHGARRRQQGSSARLGLAPHSLRAVPPDALREILLGLDSVDATAPIHIHIAEQAGEVDACMAWSGQRPVAWLLDHAAVDRRWCLVHATHMDPLEYARAASSQAVIGLCPSTEANLGDGIFDFSRWRDHGGAWGIGSDSNTCVSAAEELLLLEYGQRLATQRRNVGADQKHPDVATSLTLAAVEGGARASGRQIAGLAVGEQADFVVLDPQDIALQGLTAPDMLSAHIFASHRGSAIHAVWVAGRQRVAGGRHALHQHAAAGFVSARSELLGQ